MRDFIDMIWPICAIVLAFIIVTPIFAVAAVGWTNFVFKMFGY